MTFWGSNFQAVKDPSTRHLSHRVTYLVSYLQMKGKPQTQWRQIYSQIPPQYLQCTKLITVQIAFFDYSQLKYHQRQFSAGLFGFFTSVSLITEKKTKKTIGKSWFVPIWFWIILTIYATNSLFPMILKFHNLKKPLHWFLLVKFNIGGYFRNL